MGKQREYERRQFQVSEIRADADQGVITGYAAMFDSPARIASFDEVIRRGAFTKTIQERDIFAFWNHESGSILGRTKNNTLKLSEDERGLRVEIIPPDTPTGQEVRALIRDGYVDKMSFGFDVIQERWQERAGEPRLREITEVRLYEVSPVPIPAYDATVVSARAMERAEQQPHDPAGINAVVGSETKQHGAAEPQESALTDEPERRSRPDTRMLRMKHGATLRRNEK